LNGKKQMSGVPEEASLGLYVHIPWCIRKCPYCDFNSHANDSGLPAMRYIQALHKDLEWQLEGQPERTIDTLFIGGGTPSLFSPELIRILLDGIKSRATVASDAEITMEANPGAIECGSLQGYREAGVNRLSIGVQSFDSNHLKLLGRIHGPDEAQIAARRAKEVGFDEINLDLMFGLPGQTQVQAQLDLEMAIAHAPTHISYYQLTLEPNTRFFKNPPRLPDEDEQEAIQTTGHDLLLRSGYQRYEISAYSLPGHQCKHNLNYWQFGDYLGIGAGAHGKVRFADLAGSVRHWNVRGPEEYMVKALEQEHRSGCRKLGRSDLILEFMMNALRLCEGFEASLFTARTGVSLEGLLSCLQAPLEKGLVVFESGRLKPTPLGLRFLDDLVLEFQDK